MPESPDAGKIIEQGAPREIQERVLGHTLVEVTADRSVPIASLPQKLGNEKYTSR